MSEYPLVEMICPACGGSGKVKKADCPYCYGDGWVSLERYEAYESEVDDE
jgi:DnaJ-class molecular chaperone